MPADPKAKYVIVAEDKSAAAWASAVKTADTAGKRISGAMTAAFAGVSLGAITGAVKAAFQFGDEIGKAAEKAGIGAREMSELAYAAKMSDIEIGSLSTGLRKMQVSIAEANRGNKELRSTFAGIGVEFDAFKQLAPDQQFEALADAIHGINDPAERARVVTQLFGKAGADLLPAFSDGARGIREAREEAERLGISMSEETVAALQKGDDAIKKLSASWDAFMAKVAVGAVKLGEALDLIPKDEVGELKDELDGVLRVISMMGTASEEALKPLLDHAETLRRRIEGLSIMESRGGGASRRRQEESPGLTRDAAYDDLIHEVRITDAPRFEQAEYLRQQARDLEEYKEGLTEAYEYNEFLSESTGKAIDSIAEANLESLDETMGALQYGLDQTIESLEESTVVAEEFVRSSFSHVSDLIASAGDGAEEFGDRMIDTFKRVLADSATRELFNMIASWGKSNSGAGGVLGWLGSLASSFGGMKAEGGPLQSNKWYVAGEHGPEPIWGGGAGAFAMGYPRAAASAGALTVNVYNDFHNMRDVTDAKMVTYARQISDATVARMKDERRRGTF